MAVCAAGAEMVKGTNTRQAVRRVVTSRWSTAIAHARNHRGAKSMGRCARDGCNRKVGCGSKAWSAKTGNEYCTKACLNADEVKKGIR